MAFYQQGETIIFSEKWASVAIFFFLQIFFLPLESEINFCSNVDVLVNISIPICSFYVDVSWFLKDLDGSPASAVIFRINTSVTAYLRSDLAAALSSPLTVIHLIIFISKAATQHGLDRTKLLSLLFCLLTFFLQPHVCHIMFILPHYLSYVLSISTSMLTVFSQITPHFSTTPPASFPLSLIMSHVTFPLTPLSLSLLFSVWQWHWKVRPCHFKDGTAQELSMNAAWGTGLVHALQHGGDFGAWWTL